jgi:hypothetical protein
MVSSKTQLLLMAGNIGQAANKRPTPVSLLWFYLPSLLECWWISCSSLLQLWWSFSLRSKARFWLKLHNNMPSLNRATRVLQNNKKGLQPRMKKVSLAILMYLIWEERYRRIFNNTAKSVEAIFRKFQILFYIILYFHEKNHLAYSVASWMEPTCLLV